MKDLAWGEDERFSVAYGLSLFYKDCLLEDEKKSDSDLTLHYNECKTAKVEKQMDLEWNHLCPTLRQEVQMIRPHGTNNNL